MKLPDIGRAPDSDLSRLAVRFLVDEDFTALTPIVDELIGAGRDEDAYDIRKAVVAQIHALNDHHPHSVFCGPDVLGSTVLKTLWYDLFTWEATVDALIRTAAAHSEQLARARMRRGDTSDIRLTPGAGLVSVGGYEMVSTEFVADQGFTPLVDGDQSTGIEPPDGYHLVDGNGTLPPQDELHRLIAALTPAQYQLLQDELTRFQAEDPVVDE